MPTPRNTDFNGEREVRPSAAPANPGLPGWVLGIAVLLAGGVLFAVLEAGRQNVREPSVAPLATEALTTRPAAPPLYIPPEIMVAQPVPAPVPPPPQPTPAPVPASRPPEPRVVYVPQPAVSPAAPAPLRTANAPIIVFDASAATSSGGAAIASSPPGVAAPTETNDRARAGIFANRGTTIVQGTLIPAILETALDSSRPGFARALVSRDVRGFDGKKVLIPRGSRLIGQYQSDISPGQKRALVMWTRLIRQDGATIAIGSPAADPLGGIGIDAKVNSHFFERFASAILQSALDVGVNLASRAGDGALIVALPGIQNGTSVVRPTEIPPTLKVAQGTSISVFVARDLDFTGVEQGK